MVLAESEANLSISTLERPNKTESRADSYLFENPEQFINEKEREWLSQNVITHIAPPWLPIPSGGRKYGGIEDVVMNNVHALERFGARKQIIYGHPHNDALENSTERTEIRHPDFLNPTQDYLTLLRKDPAKARELETKYVSWAYKNAKRDDSTIIHDHTNRGRFFGLDTDRYIKPVIRTEHGPLVKPYITEEEDQHLSFFEHHATDMGFVAISNDQMSQRPSMNWLGVNHNGVDPASFEFTSKKSKDAPLIWVGRITHNKGPHNAIELARRLKRELLLVGQVEEGSGERYWEQLQYGIDGRQIKHIDGADENLRREIMSEGACLVMLNEWPEPFGMVMPEAMMSGTPVIGYNRGSIPEIVKNGKTGFVASTMDEAEHATKLILDGHYTPEECRRRAEKYFSSDAMAGRYTRNLMKQQAGFNKKNLPTTFSYSPLT